jgi:hypothetical protein
VGQHYTRGSQTVMPPIFYFVLFTIWTCEYFIEIHYFMAEDTDVLTCICLTARLFRMTLLTAHTPYRVHDVTQRKKNFTVSALW